MPPIGFPFEKVRNRLTAWKPTAVNEIPCVKLGVGVGWAGSFGSSVRSSMNYIHWTNSRTKPFHLSFLQDTHFLFCFILLGAYGLLSDPSTNSIDHSYGLVTTHHALVSTAIQEVLPFFLPLKNSPWLPSIWLSLLSRQNNNAPGSSWFFTLIKS